MILFNELNNRVSADDYSQPKTYTESAEEIKEEELEADLEEMYTKALTADLEYYQGTSSFLESRPILRGFGKKILARIREFICPELDESATREKIVEHILDALATIIPGGKIITWVIKKLISFILKKGVDAFCKLA